MPNKSTKIKKFIDNISPTIYWIHIYLMRITFPQKLSLDIERSQNVAMVWASLLLHNGSRGRGSRQQTWPPAWQSAAAPDE